MRTFLVAILCVAVVAATKSKLREAKKSRKTREFTLSFGTQAPSGPCTDKIANCASYTMSVCTDPQYSGWVTDNCCAYCSGGSSGGNVPQMTSAPMLMPSSGGSCTDAVSNCADYTMSVCSNADYATWVSTNCAKFCGKCSSSSGGGAPPLPVISSHTGSCQDTLPNCADYGASVCTNADYATWSTQNCAKFCNKCSGSGASSGGSPGCTDKNSNCAMLDSSSRICTDAGARIYAQENCAMTCNMCSGSTSGGSVPSSGGGTPAGSISSTGTGCVYNGNVYQQGQTWKDACKYTCSCVDGASGKYQCQELCVTWNLPSQCHLNPPAPGKCCQTPSCPTGYNIQYPPGYVAN
ncbi:multiple epidermal growth factor-like domains protein 11 [Mya arenaria]|uniref:multiple epidermal growth factor-like domains protein 11 n=1 Tax=Mya arenaria TaxID=6604 RepID=UPI0022E0514F|nr:multiple epidermal growth factor-like domains protein 11 [Mya arenaria]